MRSLIVVGMRVPILLVGTVYAVPVYLLDIVFRAPNANLLIGAPAACKIMYTYQGVVIVEVIRGRCLPEIGLIGEVAGVQPCETLTKPSTKMTGKTINITLAILLRLLIAMPP